MRADSYLFERGYTASRQSAKNLISSGAVLLDGKLISKPSASVDESVEHAVEITGEICPYVSRGGMKLKGAIEAFQINVAGKSALDIGASTGGFTDCLLQHGAAHVWAVDSGSSQLHPSLREDARVTVMENTNARYLTAESFPIRFDRITLDVSFISQTLILPAVAALLADNGQYIALIKPQFEVGRENVGKNGIVKGEKLYRLAIRRVVTAAADLGLVCTNLAWSPIQGGDGNTEFLALFEKSGIPYSVDRFFCEVKNHE
ncbi:MAG: TlyA family RNA methyltransferase [Clostridia bacterium]|nr:TlyA family RNA methyltransferase [Clostridia bacterium]